MIGLVVAVSSNGVIGKNGTIPWSHSGDLRFFKLITEKQSVIMGRRTWDSLPKKPLKDRFNIVVSKTGTSCDVNVNSIEEAIAVADTGNIWFIGGSQIYAAAIPFCEIMHITRVPDVVEVEGAVLFPSFNEKEWEVQDREHPFNSKLQLSTYRRRQRS